MKVIEFVKRLEEIGYDENTELTFSCVDGDSGEFYWKRPQAFQKKLQEGHGADENPGKEHPLCGRPAFYRCLWGEKNRNLFHSG